MYASRDEDGLNSCIINLLKKWIVLPDLMAAFAEKEPPMVQMGITFPLSRRPS